jgi:hypothetical protein
MPRVNPKALSAPPSQEALEDGADSTSLFTSNTVAALFDLLPHISCNRDNYLHAERRNARACAADCGARVASNHQIVRSDLGRNLT